MESFLSYYTMYTASFLWGLFFRRFAVPVLVICLLWHQWIYGLIVGSERASSSEFRYYLPLTVIFGVAMGYLLGSLVNTRRVIFWKRFDVYGCWLPLVLIEFVLLHSVFFIWETTGTFVRPVNYIITFLLFLTMIPLWYFFTAGFTVWAYYDESKKQLSFDDNAAFKFHAYWALYHLSSTLIFTVIQWSLPSVWPFWIVIGVFGFHLLIWFMISLFIVNTHTSGAPFKYKQLREKAAEHISSVPGARSLMQWLTDPQHQGIESAMMEEGSYPMEVIPAKTRRPRATREKNGANHEYEHLHSIEPRTN